MTLGELVMRVPHNCRKMHINRSLPAKCLIKQVVFRRGRKVFAAAHNVGNVHQMVVHNVCEIICRETVRFH